MISLPKVVNEAWEHKEGPSIFTTVDETGIPNSIYVSCIQKNSESSFMIADNFFSKTRHNICIGKKVSILFITKNNKAYQLKGTATRYTSGIPFETMKNWLDPKYPGKAAVVINVEEVYNGSERLV
jgi:predicted pyridoxine 5'-phosphate oxidase superfamily flavin-nucleotide-binding protein